MRQVLYQHDYYQFEYDSELKYFEIRSLPASEEMTDEDITVFLNKIGEMMESVPEIHYFMDYQRDRRWVISVEVQEWIATNLAPILIRKGAKRMAHVPPAEMIASISSEQMIDDIHEQHNSPFVTLTFETYDQAMNWLLDKKV